MKHNPVIDCLLYHKSVRKFTEQTPDQETVETIVRAGQQAPFGGQSYSILLSRKRERIPWKAPLLFTLCWDLHKFEVIMAERGWRRATCDLNALMLGMQDACYAAENMVAAGRSLGLGSCFLGSALGRIDQIAEEYKLPMRVVPIVQLVMGYSGEDPPVRPRYPLEFTLFEDQYPELDAEMVRRAMKQMDEGYLTQDYYWKARGMIPLQGGREEKYTYDNYSWTEHISRKSGQWNPDPAPLLAALERRGIHLTEKNR